MMNYISPSDTSFDKNILQVDHSEINFNLGKIISIKKKYNNKAYIVYHLFDNREGTSDKSDTYKEPFKRTGNNELGVHLMNNFDIDINIDVKVENNSMKRLLLKKV